MSLPLLSQFVPHTLSAACFAAGYATGVAAFAWMAWRRHLWTSGMISVMIAGLIGGLVCANLAQIAFVHEVGKSVLGGIAGGYLVVFFYKKRLGIRRHTGDLFAVAISAGEAVGRWGCYFGGCCYGRVCHVPWAIFQHGAYRHPTQLYMSAASASILAILLRYDRTRPPENALFYLQGMLYCASRFTIEFFRETNVAALTLSTAQWACLGGELFFAVMMYRLLAAGRDRPVLNGKAAESTHLPAEDGRPLPHATGGVSDAGLG